MTQKTFIVPTKGADGATRAIDGTTAIAISFVFLAYFLHPAIEKAYNTVRSYRSWRKMEEREQVEVTGYSMIAEILGARGELWDAARIIAVLLVAFSLASWGLELQLGLADIENGPVTLLNSPPPVLLQNDGASWEVLSPSDGLDAEQGSLCNMDDNYAKGTARSRYHVENYSLDKVNGEITVAWWSDDVEDRPLQFYNIEGITTTVELLNCSTESLKSESIFEGGNEIAWGTVDECEEGPLLSNASLEVDPTKSTSPPTIILTKTDASKAYIIVEESSSYPSFLYSVWISGDTVTDGVEIHHAFHIASTMRLAEAVVTGIVHGWENGGGCFGLLRQYSEDNFAGTLEDTSRAFPFGETPEFGVAETLDEVEAIEAGVEVNVFVLLCAVWLMVITSIGFAWSLCLSKSIGVDIYDRDALIRAVCMPVICNGAGTNNSETTPPPSSIRIFVRKEDTGHLSVAVFEIDEGKGMFERLFRRGSTVSAHDEPAPVAAATVNAHNAGFGGATLPVGPRTAWLEGRRIRTGMARSFPGPNGDFLYPSIALTASPVPSTVGSLAGTPTQASPPITAGRNSLLGRGLSVMSNDNAYSSDSSSSSVPEEGVEAGRGVRGANGDRGDNNVGNGSLVTNRAVVVFLGLNNALGTDVQTESRNNDGETPIALSGETTSETSGGSSPVPSRELTTNFTLGPPQMLRLLREASESMGPPAGIASTR